MKTIESKRLILRPITDDDDEGIFAYSKNENVGVNAGWKAHANIEETRKIMKSIFLGKENVYGIASKETGKLLGTIGLIDDPKRQNNKARMLGYAIGEEYWGNGYTQTPDAALRRNGSIRHANK
jgi:putative acetyltransferase